MYRYYVSFGHQTPDGLGMAALDITAQQRITTVDDLGPVREQLAQRGYHSIVILAFSLYAQEKNTPTTRPRTGGTRR